MDMLYQEAGHVSSSGSQVSLLQLAGLNEIL